MMPTLNGAGLWSEPYHVMLVAAGVAILVLAALNALLAARWLRTRRAVGVVRAALQSLQETHRTRRQTEERFRSLVLNTSDVITILAIDGAIDFFSPSASRIWGHAPDALKNASIFDLVHPDDGDVARGLLSQALSRPRLSMSAEMRLRLVDDTWCYFEVVATNLLRDPRVSGIVTTFRDITERKDFEQALTYQAFHDALTDLPNRTLFVDRVERALARARTNGTSASVMFIDLDNFKVINDSLGHAVGDRLLVTLTERIKSCLRHEDTLARLSGDEFAILIEDVRDHGDARRLAERVQEQLQIPFILDRREVFASVSIGIAISGPEHAEPDDLLRDADLAMYRAKANGKARCELFDSTMNEQATERLALETAMRRAIERDELRVFYQPIVRLEDASVVGFEALVRWEHPELGLISPAEFIPLAEETGMIVPIGAWVLEEACRQVKQWQDERCGDRALLLSVNVSARQFQSPDLVETVAERAGADRLRSDPPQARADREPDDAGRRAHDPAAARPQGAQDPARYRRFRHRLLVAGVPAALPDQRAEGRQIVRPAPRRGPPGRRHRPLDRDAGERPRHAGGGRGHRDGGAAPAPAQPRLRLRAGLLLQPAGAGRAGRGVRHADAPAWWSRPRSTRCRP